MYRDCNDLQPAAPVQYTLDVLVAPPAYCACVEDKTVFLILNSDRSSDVPRASEESSFRKLEVCCRSQYHCRTGAT